MTLELEVSRPIVPGVTGVLIKIAADRVRLGFEYHNGITIMRSEFQNRNLKGSEGS